ncbi:CRISPR-associated endoribonuclease Cas6 [Candidatus Aerophobetes bacterium]|nr:CRISPR-associated endoribonuclease Cas6 [Candidatus Aerophobetes bacterium]
MRLTITLQSSGPASLVKLSLHYNYALQSFIYHHISTHLANFIHNKGYRYEGRVFRLFTFSRMVGKYWIEKKDQTIVFSSPFKFQISSPVEEFIQEFAETLARVPDVSIENRSLLVSSIEVHFSPFITSPVFVRMLSPVTCYSTLLTADGKKKTYYFSPFEEEFSRLIRENIFKKYVSFYQRKPASSEFSILPAKVDKRSEKIIKYTPHRASYTIVKGWMGVYKLEGNPELIRLAYDAGLGAKNSQGFGMFEIM